MVESSEVQMPKAHFAADWTNLPNDFALCTHQKEYSRERVRRECRGRQQVLIRRDKCDVGTQQIGRYPKQA